MIYWKCFLKSGDPDNPDFIFRLCEPKSDKRHCIERWDGSAWIEASVENPRLEDFIGGEPGARRITESEAKKFISAAS